MIMYFLIKGVIFVCTTAFTLFFIFDRSFRNGVTDSICSTFKFVRRGFRTERMWIQKKAKRIGTQYVTHLIHYMRPHGQSYNEQILAELEKEMGYGEHIRPTLFNYYCVRWSKRLPIQWDASVTVKSAAMSMAKKALV